MLVGVWRSSSALLCFSTELVSTLSVSRNQRICHREVRGSEILRRRTPGAKRTIFLTKSISISLARQWSTLAFSCSISARLIFPDLELVSFPSDEESARELSNLDDLRRLVGLGVSRDDTCSASTNESSTQLPCSWLSSGNIVVVADSV